MQTDRELIELAAKAAGNGARWSQDDPFGLRAMLLPKGMSWNPLDDDGDALRLAVRTGLQIDTNTDAHSFAGLSMDESGLGYCECHNGDPFAATRRAIVRAAAALAASHPQETQPHE